MIATRIYPRFQRGADCKVRLSNSRTSPDLESKGDAPKSGLALPFVDVVRQKSSCLCLPTVIAGLIIEVFVFQGRSNLVFDCPHISISSIKMSTLFREKSVVFSTIYLN